MAPLKVSLKRHLFQIQFEIHNLTERHYYRIMVVIINLEPAQLRTRFGRAALDYLHRWDIPVAWGEKATTKNRSVRFSQFDCDFVSGNIFFTPYGQPKSDLTDPAEIESGISFLDRLVKGIVETPDSQPKTPKPQEKLTYLLISSLTDIWKFAKLQPRNFVKATSRIVLQGGYTVEHDPSNSSYALIADSFANNNGGFDMDSANEFHEFICRNNIPSIVFTKVAATASALSTNVLEDLAFTGHILGKYIYKYHVALSREYYEASGDEKTRFRPHMDQKWFLRTRTNWFLSHTEHEPYPTSTEVLQYVQVTPYDPLAGLEVAGPDLRDALKILKPFKDQTIHKVVGKRAPNPEMNDPGDPGINSKETKLVLVALWKGSLMATCPIILDYSSSERPTSAQRIDGGDMAESSTIFNVGG